MRYFSIFLFLLAACAGDPEETTADAGIFDAAGTDAGKTCSGEIADGDYAGTISWTAVPCGQGAIVLRFRNGQATTFDMMEQYSTDLSASSCAPRVDYGYAYESGGVRDEQTRSFALIYVDGVFEGTVETTRRHFEQGVLTSECSGEGTIELRPN